MGSNKNYSWDELKTRKSFQLLQRVALISSGSIGLLAIILIIVGSVVWTDLKGLDSIYKQTIPVGLIVIGIALLLMSVIGFCGTSLLNLKCILIYMVLMAVLIVCELGIAFGSYALRNNIPHALEREWASSANSDRNTIQSKFSCCGFMNNTDSPGTNCWNGTNPCTWEGNCTTTGTTANPTVTVSDPTTGQATTAEPTTSALPDVPDSNTTGGPSRREEFFDAMLEEGIMKRKPLNEPGCQNQLISAFRTQLYVVGTVGVIFALLQIVGLSTIIALFFWLKCAGPSKFSNLRDDT